MFSTVWHSHFAIAPSSNFCKSCCWSTKCIFASLFCWISNLTMDQVLPCLSFNGSPSDWDSFGPRITGCRDLKKNLQKLLLVQLCNARRTDWFCCKILVLNQTNQLFTNNALEVMRLLSSYFQLRNVAIHQKKLIRIASWIGLRIEVCSLVILSSFLSHASKFSSACLHFTCV